jgi:O-antigen biosynthesis protein WbqP
LNGDGLVRRSAYLLFFKPVLDRAAALLLLILLLPVLGVVALLVKLDSRGPVLFRQRRVGLDKGEFPVLKFRTMYTDAPSDTPTHLLKDATSHITRIGGFLRKSSLDELPQIFNILGGDMSFVGPRPALWNQYDLIAERDRYGANSLMPGLTGWAQVTGRDELPIPEKAEKDGWYAGHVCFALDVRIVFRTLYNVLSAKGIVEGSSDGEH